MRTVRSNGFHKLELTVGRGIFTVRQNGNTVRMKARDMDRFWKAACQEWDTDQAEKEGRK